VGDFLTRLRDELGERVCTDTAVRAAHRRDTWVLEELHDLEGAPGALPLAVVEAESTRDVVTTLRLCRAARIPVVPYGGGSGVCGGIRAREGDLVLSTRRLEGLVALDSDSLTASFRAGTNGLEAERRVQKEGLTIGHWPQSIEISTVGGWVATRASGQFSTAYGSIEDLILDLEAVLPDGTILRTRRTPRASAGPDLRQLLLGSEGTLGVITEVTFSLRPLPPASQGQSVHFPHFAAGVEAVRRFVRAGWRPPVVRLYDPLESKRNFDDPCPGRALLVLLHEGPEELVAAQMRAVADLCGAAEGALADPTLADRWLEHRNRVPGFRSFLEKGIILDTIEVAATWDKVVPLYERAIASLREVPGILAASAHSSHSYRSGTNLYFTFAARPAERERMESTYADCWRRVMRAAVDLGGGLAHHHGIGRVRREFLRDELGEGGLALLRAVKRALDPDDLLNPGVLLPDAEASGP
jgi:alkyldihydroxyacetonephosphate synthase